MINLVEAPFGREIKNLNKETFVEKLSPYLNKELVDLIVAEDKVEITYDIYDKVCRFDFVNIEPMLNEEFISKEKDEEYGYEFINIDLDFKEGKIIIYIELDELDSMLSGISEDRKKDLILKFKELKSVLREKDFYLEVCYNSTMYLVSDDLKSLTVNKVSDALNKVEEFRKVVFNFKTL